MNRRPVPTFKISENLVDLKFGSGRAETELLLGGSDLAEL